MVSHRRAGRQDEASAAPRATPRGPAFFAGIWRGLQGGARIGQPEAASLTLTATERMSSSQPPDPGAGERSELEQAVEQVVSAAHVESGALSSEERQYLEEHALKKPMGVLH